MSASKDKVDEDSSLNIPGILADFFLKKINMPYLSEDSDKYRSRKKSKHKKRKHKKSKHRHRSNSSDSSCRTSGSNAKGVEEVSKSSEEMDIKRLKKIKNFKMNPISSIVLQSSATPSEMSEKDIQSNSSTSENPVFYGPSLELLLTGTESSKLNTKFDLLTHSVSSKIANVPENVISKSDKSAENSLTENSVQVASKNSNGKSLLDHKRSDMNSKVSASVNVIDDSKLAKQDYSFMDNNNKCSKKLDASMSDAKSDCDQFVHDFKDNSLVKNSQNYSKLNPDVTDSKSTSEVLNYENDSITNISISESTDYKEKVAFGEMEGLKNGAELHSGSEVLISQVSDSTNVAIVSGRSEGVLSSKTNDSKSGAKMNVESEVLPPEVNYSKCSAELNAVLSSKNQPENDNKSVLDSFNVEAIDNAKLEDKSDLLAHQDSSNVAKVDSKHSRSHSRSRSRTKDLSAKVKHTKKRSQSKSHSKDTSPYTKHMRKKSRSDSRTRHRSPKPKHTRRRSRSRTRSKSHTKDTSSKTKHTRKRSRSKSLTRHTSPKTKHERNKSRSHSRSKSITKDLSPKTKHTRRSRSGSHTKDASPKTKHDKNKSRSRSRSKSLTKNSSPKTKHEKNKSRSRSKSKSCTRDTSSKSKQRRQRSRSTSKENDSKKKRQFSRSRSRSYGRTRNRERDQSYSRNRPRSQSRSRFRRNWRYSRSPYKRSSRRQSRSRSRSRRRSKDKSKSKMRKHSRSSERHHSSSRSSHRTKSSKRSPSHSKSRSKSKSRHKSVEKYDSRSKSKEKTSSSDKTNKIDQAKILETARKNILKMMKNGTLPDGLPVEKLQKEQLISIHAGGKSVQELTDFCQRLSQKENDPDMSDNENEEKADDDTGFIHHPFKVKEATTIKLNIKNAVQLPIKTHAQKIAETARLSSQFPVSSGNQHRKKELEWVPVVTENLKTETKPTVTATTTKSETINVIVPLPVSTVSPIPPPPAPPLAISYPCKPTTAVSTIETPASVSMMISSSLQPPPPPPPPPHPPPLPPPPPPSECSTFYQTPPQPVMQTYMIPEQQMPAYVIPEQPPPPIESYTTPVFKPRKRLDVASIVTKRFQALTKLQEDPNDIEALTTLQEAQQSIQEWVESQQVPGLFTGSTDVKVLSAAELCGPFKYYKNRKDMLTHAPPVTDGKGMSLLKKMGWNPGEGLGKNKEGSLEPLVLDIKTDKKGLVGEGENSKKAGVSSFIKELQGKHPVSALMELCSKRKWKPPLYTCVLDSGPAHKKTFCFKVEVNGVEYQPLNPCSNKKVAKADSAVLCLQSLNVLPKTTMTTQ